MVHKIFLSTKIHDSPGLLATSRTSSIKTHSDPTQTPTQTPKVQPPSIAPLNRSATVGGTGSALHPKRSRETFDVEDAHAVLPRHIPGLARELVHTHGLAEAKGRVPRHWSPRHRPRSRFRSKVCVCVCAVSEKVDWMRYIW